MSKEKRGNTADGAIDPPQAGAVDLAESVEIERTSDKITARVHHFPALTGWELRRQYREFLESKDAAFRMAFTVAVLSHASVSLKNGNEQIDVYLNSSSEIDGILESWQNVEKVFGAVLGYNGIKTDLAEVERRRWQVAGEDMAASFLASVSSMIGPALTIAADKKAKD